MEVIDAIKNRRSIRKYKSANVDELTLEFVLNAARNAPSWKNTQCCRFIVVRSTENKSALVDVMLAGANAYIKNAPVVIVACAELKKTGLHSDGTNATDKGDYWYMYDVALAMQNLALAAYSVGLGTVHIGLFDAKKAAKVLQVPAGFCVVAMTPLGYPDEEPKPRTRKELSEIVFHEKFGAK